MPVIAFANSKGGSGKTTSALLLAQALATHRPTTLIDADPRHPITTWSQMKGCPHQLSVVTNEGEKTILDEIEAAAARDPFVIIDLEGTASRLMSYAISQADLVIIPTKEQQQDAVAALAVIQEIHRDMKAMRRRIPYAVLFTQSRAAVKSRTARHIAAQFKDNPDIDVFDTEIHERDAFAAMFSMGGTVAAMDPRQVNGLDRALGNIDAFSHEVIAKLRSIRTEQRTETEERGCVMTARGSLTMPQLDDLSDDLDDFAPRSAGQGRVRGLSPASQITQRSVDAVSQFPSREASADAQLNLKGPKPVLDRFRAMCKADRRTYYDMLEILMDRFDEK